uniref:Venom protein n=1 Tax=Hadrurus spadix TaxID=141984 RepID=A0A1W7R986_9SCOR
MKEMLFVLFSIMFVTHFYDKVLSQSLNEDHWKFICGASRETVAKLLSCYFEKESEDMIEKYKRLEQCMQMPQIDIVETFCRRDTTLSNEERENLMSCLAVDFTSSKMPKSADPMVGCVENMPGFRKKMQV